MFLELSVWDYSSFDRSGTTELKLNFLDSRLEFFDPSVALITKNTRPDGQIVVLDSQKCRDSFANLQFF